MDSNPELWTVPLAGRPAAVRGPSRSSRLEQKARGRFSAGGLQWRPRARHLRLPGFADDCFLSRATEASPALARARSRYGPMDKARRICKNANVQDYGSRDSVYAYITREDLVRIPVAIFFFFFCPLDHLRRGKPNSGVWRRMSTLVPYERRARPAKYHDVGARSPRRHEVHAARAVEPWGARRRRDAGWLAATRRSSPP